MKKTLVILMFLPVVAFGQKDTSFRMVNWSDHTFKVNHATNSRTNTFFEINKVTGTLKGEVLIRQSVDGENFHEKVIPLKNVAKQTIIAETVFYPFNTIVIKSRGVSVIDVTPH